MNTPNEVKRPYKAQAIILLSGIGSLSLIDKALTVLNSYSLTVLERQDIDIAGRIICALLIGFDPAHAEAIDRELADVMREHQIDVAIDII